MVEPDYWSAAATVMPVLAAALVIEGKELNRQHRERRYPRWLLGTQYLLSSISLLGMGASIGECFRVLRGGVIRPIWFLIIEGSISLSIGALIFGPAVVLFSSATVMYYFLLRSVPLRWSLRIANTKVHRLEQRLRSEYWKNRAFALREIKLAADLRGQAEVELANAPEDSEERDRLEDQVRVAREYEEVMRNYLEGVEERHESFRKDQAEYEQENSDGQRSEFDLTQRGEQ